MIKQIQVPLIATALTVAFGAQNPVSAQSQDAAELGKQLNNPISSLVSVPFQLDYDNNIGVDDKADSWNLKIEPVIPFRLTDDWNLISRTIVSLTRFNDLPNGSGTDFGIGDTTQSFFLSPQRVRNGWTWGVGPVISLPTSRWNDDSSRPKFGAGEWGLGPTAVALRQTGGWTYGMLANHIWDVSGDTDISNTFLQPFLAYTTPDAWTYAINSESSYNWEADKDHWTIPINFQVGKVIKLGDQHVQLKGAVRYWADSPDAGAEDWGFRLVATFLFPK